MGPDRTKWGDYVSVRDMSERDRKDYRIITTLRFLMVVGFLSPVYYLVVWRNIPAQNMRVIATGVVGIGAILAFLLVQTYKHTGFDTASKTIPILLIIFGAIFTSLVFSIERLEVIFKIFVVLFFSLLPGGLYLHFFWTKGQTLKDEYILNLHRLHIDNYANLPEPPKQSIFYERWAKGRVSGETKPSIYIKKFYTAIFGTLGENKFTFTNLRAENVWPVATATLLISVGWVIVVRLGPLGQSYFGDATPVQSSLNVQPNVQPINLPDLFNSLSFAFLGAYFYILQMLVRRYFQNDLKTTAYINAIMRIVIVILLVLVVDLLLERQKGVEVIDTATRKAIAFVIGVFPQVGWQALQTLIRKSFVIAVPVLKRKHPLHELDGLNMWYESRLLEEGIEDMQNLATANLLDVIIHTRIPVDRLIDWIDQSILYLHIGKSKDALEKLRSLGIRTATDLDDAFSSGDPVLVERLEYLLNEDKDKEPSVLRCINTTFKDEPNLYYVKQWKGFEDRDLKPETDALEKAQTEALKNTKSAKTSLPTT